MKTELNFWVVGGDMRQVKLAQLLCEDGHTVHTYALALAPSLPGTAEESLQEAALADCVVLPLPVEGEGSLLNAPLSAGRHPLAEILTPLRPGQIICAGRVTRTAANLAAERGLVLCDYFAREELAVANAVPTAEGAIQIALEELPITLHSAKVLVIGYGRVGKLTAHRLTGLGAQVTIAARKYADLAWAEAMGYGVKQTGALLGSLSGYDLIISTVPARVLSERELRDLRPGALVIDLASKPGGVDFEGAAALGVKVIWALSLPGKVAPETAGRSIRNTVYNILSELGV
ncbi:MAG: dipicolinate synthase subunit DpsA [Pseudoflavonifractor sp.]